MSNVIKGWKPASRFCGGVPVRTLRKAVLEEHTLPATKGPDGVWSFAESDLEAFASRNAAAPPLAQPAPLEALEVDAEPELAAVTDVQTSRVPPPIPDWLLAACEPDGFAAAQDTRAERVPGPPLGASRTFGRSWLDQIPAAPAPAQLVEVEAARRDADAARTTADRAKQPIGAWRDAYRRERVQAIAGAIALEVLAAGHRDPKVVYGVRDAVGGALQQLREEQLVDDQHAYAVARSVAAWHLHAWQPNESPQHDDLARARLRRHRR